MAKTLTRTVFTLLALAGFTAGAEAHTGHGSTIGFMHGFLHPLSGLDHVLAMVAVGLFAVRLGGKALWMVPAAFVGMMIVGGAMGMNGMGLPGVEFGIAASVIVLGAAVALDFNLPTSLAMGLVGFFALFHGHAHGAEMPLEASGFTYGIGFVIATALLHCAGLGLGHSISRATSSRHSGLVKLTGAAMAVAGVGIMTGYL
ncbi:MAG: HupE/UreJ family protein [Aestuariivirga sp.]